MTAILDTRRKQLLYRAQHRGFKEADLLLGGFASARLAGMDDAELQEFEDLLRLDDRDLYDWITGKRAAPADICGPVFEALRKFDVAAFLAT